jgi:hypothetical protein
MSESIQAGLLSRFGKDVIDKMVEELSLESKKTDSEEKT